MKRSIFFLSVLLVIFACSSQDKLNIVPKSGQLKDYLGKPTLFINDTPTEPMIYALTTCPGGRWSWDEMPAYSIKRFSNEAHFTLFQGELWMRDIFPNDDYNLDIELVRKQIRGFVEGNPNAAVFIRLRCNSSPKWNLQNKEECVVWADTTPIYKEEDGLHRWDDHDTENSLRYSPASKIWRDDMLKKIKILCNELAKTPEGNALVGIQIATNIYGENHYWGFITHEPDVSEPMQVHFREWLTNKYKTNEALQKAWNKSDVTFENAKVPRMKERFPNDLDGIFRHPAKEMQMIDYSKCQHELVADNILLFCKTAKENWTRPLITGAFYGYFFYNFGRQATGGHLAMEKMLNSPYIDYLSAPMTYAHYAKELGGSGHSRGIIEECRMHNKIWLDEFDNSSSLHPKNMKEYLSDYTNNIDEDIALIRRNIASTYTKGGGCWFYDFGPRTIGGWWNDSTLLKDIGKMKSIFEEYGKKPYKHDADVLVVYDTKVFYYLAHNWSIDIISHTGVEWATTDLFQSGIAFDMCLLFDLDKMDIDKYKAVLFANTFLLSDKEREFIKTKVATNARTLIWNYMPGYCNGNKLDDDFVKDLVQIDIEKTKIKQALPVVEMITDKKNTFGVKDTYPTVFDFEKSLRANYSVWNNNPPVFVIKDKNATAIAKFKNDGNVAIAVKKLDNWSSVFCSLPLQNENIMRRIFKIAGCHIYNNSGDVIYDGGGILVVHTKTGGKREINLRNGEKINTELAAKSTTLFDSETGEVLLK